MAAGQELAKEDKRIVGKAARGSIDKEIMGDAKQKLTTQQKIERELTYVKESLDLSPSEAKHWGYRIKREYEN